MDTKILEKASVPVPFAKITAQEPENKEFTRCKIYVQGVGKNRNYSYMSEDSIKNALPTLSYVPVVGHLIPKYDDAGNQCGYYFGSHDYVVDDDLKLHATTVPFGVVIDDSFGFEDIDEFGKTVKYLTCDAYLWTGRYPELKEAIYSDDVWFNQSMEVTNIQYRPLEEDSNYAEFLSWNYSALCILGKSDDPEYHTEPCYINAHIEPVKFDLDTTQFSQMMGEMREQLSLCFVNKQKGGNKLTQQERDEIFSKHNLTVDQVDFEISDEMTSDELEEKLKAFAVSHEKPEGHDETPVSFSLTYREKREALSKLCASLNYVKKENDEFVEERDCYLEDFDDESVYYSESIWAKDNYVCKRKKCGYSISDGVAAWSGEPVEVFQKWLTAEEIKKLEDDKKQLEALTQFKKDTEKASYDAKVSSLLEKFSDISGLKEFEEIKEEAEKSETYDTANFEMRLFALRGMQVRTDNKPQAGAVKVGISGNSESDDDGYGGLVSRAHNRRK